MEAKYLSETPVEFQGTARLYIPDDRPAYSYRREYLIPNIFWYIPYSELFETNAFHIRFKICCKVVQEKEEQLNEIHQLLGGADIAKLLGGSINRLSIKKKRKLY
jgi:hypothetical protein